MGVTAKDNRLFVEAVLYRYRVGIPWRDLPSRFGNYMIKEPLISYVLLILLPLLFGLIDDTP